MAKSFAETHPRNPNATCECEHWQSCIDCHPTAHGEKYITDSMRVRQAVAQAVLHEPAQQGPVAYLCENAVGHKYFRWKKPSSTYKPIALYTTPPVQRTWVGLTDEDELDWDGGDLKSLVEAIEAKLKEKNT